MAARKQKSLVKTMAIYSSSHVYRNVLGMINAFIKPKLLTPELMGLWTILNIIPTYAAYLHLGTMDAIRFQVPFHAAREEYKKIRVIKDTVFTSSLFPNLFLAAGLLIFFFAGDMKPEIRTGVLAIAVIVILAWYHHNYLSYLKAVQEFNLIAASNYVKVTVLFVLGLPLIYFFSIYGVYLSVILSLAIVIFYLRKRRPMEHDTGFDSTVFIDLIKTGFPIMLMDFSVILLGSTDRIVVAYFLGLQYTGYYAIAVMVFGFLMGIPGASREVIEPKVMESISACADEDPIQEYFLKPMVNTAYFIPFLLGPVFFILPLIILVLLPKYSPGVLPTQILVLGGYFLAMAYLARGIIVAKKWQAGAVTVTMGTVIFNIIMSIIMIKLDLGMAGVATASSISFFLLFLSLAMFIKKRYGYSRPEWKMNMAGICWPFLVMLVAVAGLGLYSEQWISNEYLLALFNLSVYSLIMLTVVYMAQRKYPFLKKIKFTYPAI